MCKYVGGNIKVVDSVVLATTGVIYSKSIDTNMGKFFGIFVKATSVLGTPNYKIQWETSYKPPDTEQIADITFVIPDGMPDITSTTNDEVWHAFSVNPVPGGFGRLKITGVSANPADTIISVYLFIQG